MKAIVNYPDNLIDDARKTQFDKVPHRIMERVKDQEVTIEGDYKTIDPEQEYLIEHLRPDGRWPGRDGLLKTRIYIKGKYLQKI